MDDTFLQQQVEWAQRRYLAAIKGLALMRRLDFLFLQVNIGEKQVNVATGSYPKRAPGVSNTDGGPYFGSGLTLDTATEPLGNRIGT